MNDITAAELRRRLAYDPDTGVFKWATTDSCRHFGRVAGSYNKFGYSKIKVCGRLYLAHRLAWLYVHGKWPDGNIDHINGNKSDNRIANLREASCSENAANRRGPNANSKSGIRGVYWSKSVGKWVASLCHRNKPRYLGVFASREDASEAYERAASEAFGDFYSSHGLAQN